MSAPLTPEEREVLAGALGCEFHPAGYGECAACSAHAEQVWDDGLGHIIARIRDEAVTAAVAAERERITKRVAEMVEAMPEAAEWPHYLMNGDES